MRFSPHRRVIELLIGQQLYTSADAAIRELIQNAEDACSLQAIREPSLAPHIVVRFSNSENWIEVADNGIGMDQEVLEQSFASVGAPKTDVSHIRELLSTAAGQQHRQIAQFGIGVLSCFGVAESIVVRSKMDNKRGLAFRVHDYHEDFEELNDPPDNRGTNIRLLLKPAGPMRADQVPAAVERYVRHAAHVELYNCDSAERSVISEKWEVPDKEKAFRLEDPSLRDGRLGLDSSWDNPASSISSGLVTCNSGFLVNQRELSLLPNTAIGYRGEIDVEPGELTILINREGFQHDSRWQALGQRLLIAYNRLLRDKLAAWEALLEAEEDVSHQAIDRNLLILSKSAARSVMEPDVLARIDRLVPQSVRVIVTGEDEQRPISDVVDQSQTKGTVYYIREGEGARQFQQEVQQGAGSVHVTEVAQTETLRAIHLRAKGGIVVRCRPRSYTIELAGLVTQVGIHEADLLQEECTRRGIRCISVDAASPEEVELDAVEQSALLNDLLDLSEPLKLAFVESSDDPVIRDFAGRLLNYRNADVREILGTLPDAVGNPVRRMLLQIYIDISNYRIESARRQVKQLLTSEDLPEQAQLSTGEFLRDYLRRKLQPLIGGDE